MRTFSTGVKKHIIKNFVVPFTDDKTRKKQLKQTNNLTNAESAMIAPLRIIADPIVGVSMIVGGVGALASGLLVGIIGIPAGMLCNDSLLGFGVSTLEGGVIIGGTLLVVGTFTAVVDPIVTAVCLPFNIVQGIRHRDKIAHHGGHDNIECIINRDRRSSSVSQEKLISHLMSDKKDSSSNLRSSIHESMRTSSQFFKLPKNTKPKEPDEPFVISAPVFKA